MSRWSADDLNRIARAEEVQITSMRRDGTFRRPVTIWAVRAGDDVYVRSVNGRKGHWFSGVEERHQGRIRAGGVDRDVTFKDAGADHRDEIDAAYRAKYRRYSGPVLNSVLTPGARAATLKLEPVATS